MSERRPELESPLPPEDDWFGEPVDEDRPYGTPEPDVPIWVEEGPPERKARDRGSPPVVALVVLGVVLLAAAGAILAWALSGSDSGETTTPGVTVPTVTPTATTPEETSTEPAATETTATTTPSETVTLRQGDEGAAVRSLQEDLVALGYETGGVDGNYGSQTVAAVTAFQSANGLTADGIAGPETLAALEKAVAGQ